jgi:hypothetical protein
MKKGFLTILVIISLMFVPLIASAAYTSLDFDVIDGGTISYSTNPLIGSGLRIDRIKAIADYGKGTSKSLEITNGTLNFTSGAHISGWSWGPGGSITITGGVRELGPDGMSNPYGEQIIPDDTILLTGSFNSAEAYPSGEGLFKVAISDLSDTKDLRLVSYFGFDPRSAWVGNFGINFITQNDIGQFFYASVDSGDVYNTPVPIPPTILLLGAGLMGVGFIRKK